MMERHHLTVDEAVQIQLIRQNYELFYAESRVFNHVSVPLPSLDNIADLELLNAWAKWHTDIGETCDLIKQALEGNKITRAQIAAIKKEMFEDFQRELELLQRIDALCDE